MTPTRLILIALLGAFALLLAIVPQYLVDRVEPPAGTPAGPLETRRSGAPERAEIEQVVRSYLIRNPEILREMATALQAKEAQTAVAQRAQVFAEHRALIYSSDKQVVLGDPNGDVTLVEFFDYNCGYCRRALDDMNALMAKDPKLRIVLKEFPVLGEPSREAARVSVALHKQAPAKYLDFHRKLLSGNRAADGAQALAVARELGADMDRLAADLADPAVDATIEESLMLAQLLGIEGTPTYIVADTVVPGALGAEALAQIVANARSCGKAACS